METTKNATEEMVETAERPVTTDNPKKDFK